MSSDVLLAIARARDAVLADAASDQARTIRAAYWVLDGSGAVAALCESLPKLTAQLDRRTSRKRVEAPVVRGKLDWPATVRARATSGNNASLVSRIVERSYDVPENQLLLFVVTRALETLDRLPLAIRDGVLQEPRDNAVVIGSVRERVEALRAVLRDRKLHARLTNVTLPSRIDARWTRAASAADVREYADVVAAHDAWQRGVVEPTWAIASPGGVVLVPSTTDAQAWIALAAKRTQRAVRVGGR
jgi:hypothetical protein